MGFPVSPPVRPGARLRPLAVRRRLGLSASRSAARASCSRLRLSALRSVAGLPCSRPGQAPGPVSWHLKPHWVYPATRGLEPPSVRLRPALPPMRPVVFPARGESPSPAMLRAVRRRPASPPLHLPWPASVAADIDRKLRPRRSRRRSPASRVRRATCWMTVAERRQLQTPPRRQQSSASLPPTEQPPRVARGQLARHFRHEAGSRVSAAGPASRGRRAVGKLPGKTTVACVASAPPGIVAAARSSAAANPSAA